MKKLITSVLLGAMALTAIAQQDTMNTRGDNLSFHCQIEGQDITVPCMWSDLERIGWSFWNPKDSAEVISPTYNLSLVDDREIPVLSPQKRKAVILCCNVSGEYVTRKESMVFGILYASDAPPTTVYDFKLPGGITSGMSSNDLEATYQAPEQCGLYDLWRDVNSDNKFALVVSNDSTKTVAEGIVIGFGTVAVREVERLIDQAGIAVSDEQANDMGTRQMYKHDIIDLTNELQLAQSDTVTNNPAYIAQLKYSLAMNYYFLDDFDKSFELGLQSAESGHAEAQYSIGVMYSRGEGVEQDYQSAVSWYEKAALQDQPEAMNNLGDCYLKGVGVEQSDAKAFQWWLKAAQNGFYPIYTSLADCYRDGLLGVKRDYKQAVAWYEKAANEDNPVGIYNLSYMYYYGYGVKRDYRKAFEILLDADMDMYHVQQALGDNYYYGRGVEKDIQKAITHYSNFLDLIESEDAEARESCAKEIKKAHKVIEKYSSNSETQAISHSN